MTEKPMDLTTGNFWDYLSVLDACAPGRPDDKKRLSTDDEILERIARAGREDARKNPLKKAVSSDSPA